MKKLRDYETEKPLNLLINENTYIWSDQHFGHNNVTKFEPIRDSFMKANKIINLDDYMINKWNEIASKGNVVLSLGDLAFKGISEYSKQIIGEKILLKGNHDRDTNFIYNDAGFKIIDSAFVNIKGKDYRIDKKYHNLLTCYIKEICGVKILFSHFPIYDNNPYDVKFEPVRKILESLYEDFSCDVNIYGHTHSKESAFKNSINVCVEKLNFEPIQIKTLLEMYV